MDEASMSNGGMLYHEVQESKLCAVHCVNTVLQGPFFSEFDLAALASDLDKTEREMLLSLGDEEDSQNVSLRGDFSIQVLQKAMEVWDLQVIPLSSPVAGNSQAHPELETAFICHLQDHWFCIRKVNGEWYNFNSLYPAPEHLSKFYLSAYLSTLKTSGWSIFIVRGNFPKECPMSSSEGSYGYGQWLLPEDAEKMNKSVNNNEKIGEGSRSGVEEDFVNPFGNNNNYNEDEDADLNAAIAASLVHYATTTLDETKSKSVTGEVQLGTSSEAANSEGETKNKNSTECSSSGANEAEAGKDKEKEG